MLRSLLGDTRLQVPRRKGRSTRRMNRRRIDRIKRRKTPVFIEALYNLSEDPIEAHNILEDMPELAAAANETLRRLAQDEVARLHKLKVIPGVVRRSDGVRKIGWCIGI